MCVCVLKRSSISTFMHVVYKHKLASTHAQHRKNLKRFLESFPCLLKDKELRGSQWLSTWTYGLVRPCDAFIFFSIASETILKWRSLGVWIGLVFSASWRLRRQKSLKPSRQKQQSWEGRHVRKHALCRHIGKKSLCTAENPSSPEAWGF